MDLFSFVLHIITGHRPNTVEASVRRMLDLPALLSFILPSPPPQAMPSMLSGASMGVQGDNFGSRISRDGPPGPAGASLVPIAYFPTSLGTMIISADRLYTTSWRDCTNGGWRMVACQTVQGGGRSGMTMAIRLGLSLQS